MFAALVARAVGQAPGRAADGAKRRSPAEGLTEAQAERELRRLMWRPSTGGGERQDSPKPPRAIFGCGKPVVTIEHAGKTPVCNDVAGLHALALAGGCRAVRGRVSACASGCWF